nr:polysaccharide biosynthesis tyrosine autokinase [Stenotrophomonas geniculata]
MKTNSRTTQEDGSDELDLRQLLGTLLDHRWWILASTLLFFAVAAAYALLAAPIYRADAVIQVESKMPSIPGLTDLSKSLGLGSGSGEATTEIALIKSRAVVGSAVDALKLDIEIAPKRFPLIGGFLARRAEAVDPAGLASPILGLSRYGWGGDTLQIHRLDVPRGLVEEALTLVAGEKGAFELLGPDGEKILGGQLGQPAKASGVTLEVAALRANPGMRFTVIKRRQLAVINELQERIGVAEIGKDSGILGLFYENRDPEAAETFLHQVALAYVRQNVERNSAEASAQLSFVKEQLPGIRMQVETSQKALSEFQMRENSVDLSLQTKGLLDQGVAVETSIQQLRLQQAEMDRKFTRDHPAYQALMRQIGDLEARKNGFQGEVKQLPKAQQELLRLTRDLTVANEMYTVMLSQAQQLDVARAGTVGNVRIVDAARVDDSTPVKPKRQVIALIGACAGFLLAVLAILLRQMINRGIEDPGLIEELGIPVYASIPASENQAKDSVRGKFRQDGNLHLLAVKDPADLAIEALRSLRTSLHFARLEAKNNIVLISGASPNAGKTFVSTNLATVVAQSGQRVLIIDADMRKGTMHRAFGVTQTPGLSEVIVGAAQISDAIRSFGPVDGLDFIARGEVPPNPSELLMHPNMTRLLEEVSSRYDLVIVDTPPILAVTDAAILAAQAGTSLLVARFGLNQQKEIALARKRFEQNGAVIRGAIFNAVQKRATGYYSYGYYEYKSTE